MNGKSEHALACSVRVYLGSCHMALVVRAGMFWKSQDRFGEHVLEC